MSAPVPLSWLAGRVSRTKLEAAIRGAARAVPMGDGLLLCRVLGRYRMLVAAADLRHAPHLALDGFWKIWVTSWIAGALRPGDTFIDGGAGYGYFTLLAAELVGDAGAVIAVEPHPGTAALLRHTLALNGRDAARLATCALVRPASPTAVRMRLPSADPLGAAVLSEQARCPAGEAEVSITGTTAATLVPVRGSVLIKLDVNGGEAAAWDGLSGALRPGVRVLLSFDPARCDDPAGFIASLAAAAPLRRIDAAGRVRPTAAAELLAGGAATLLVAP